MSDLSYPFSVTVDTEVKQNDDIYYLNVKNFQYFGLSEKAVQTDSTLQDSLQMDYREKQNKENKAKQESLMAPINSSTKKELTNILIESIKINNSGNKYIDIKDDNNNDEHIQSISKSSKKSKKEEKKEVKRDKENFLDKKRKRVDEEKLSPTKNKNKLKELNKSKEKEKDKDKEKSKIKSLKEKTSKIKQKEEKSEKSEKAQVSSDKKEKQEN